MMTDQLALDFFLRMLLGHLVGDFVFQSYKLALAKREGWRGLIIHVSIVTITTAIAIFNIIPGWYIWVFVLFGIHLFIDQFRTFVFTDNSNGKGLMLFLLDQLAHLLSIILISWLAVGWRFSHLALFMERSLSTVDVILLLACMLVVAIWVTPILEVELATAIISRKGKSDKTMVPVRPTDRIMGASERLVSLGLSIISLGLFIPLAFLPRIYWLLYKDTSPDKITIYSKVGTSFMTAIVLSLPLWYTFSL